MVLGISCNSDLATVCLHLFTLRYSRFRVIRALGMDCRMKDLEDARHVWLIKYHNMIHTPQRRDKRHAFSFVENRPPVSFERPYRTIAIDCDHKGISERARPFKVSHMADVKDIEASVGQHCLLALDQRGKFLEGSLFQAVSP